MLYRAAFAIVAVACIGASVWHAREIAYAPDGLPTWDSAGYLLEAVKIHTSLVSADVVGVLKGLTKPDLHPPLHAGLLAAFLTVAGNTLDAARLYPAVCFVVSLGMLVWIGQRAVPGRGVEVGLGAAVLTSLGAGNLELLSTPMTESSGLVTQLLALGLAVQWTDRRDAGAQAGIGFAVLAATLVRFNMAPMLLAPLYMHHVAANWRDRNALFDPRVLLWAAPTLGGFAVWQLGRPDLFGYIQKFFENRSSGIPFWSVENLLWVPLSTHREYLPFLGWLLFPPFLVGLFTRNSGGLGRLQAFVLVSFAALTWHDFKITRNLATVLPVFYVCALAPLAKAPKAAVVGAISLLAGCGYGVWQHRVTLADLGSKTDFQPDPIVRQALDFIEKHARTREQTWVTGWVFRLSPNLIDYWLRVTGVPGKLRLDQQLFGTQSRTGVDAPWSEDYAKYVAETALAPDQRDRTTYITIETVPGTKYFDQWKAFGNHYARAFAEQTLVPEVDRVEFVDEGLTLRAYRTNDTPSAETIAARVTGPTPEDELGVWLPRELTPLWRDTFHGKARKWMAYPPSAMGPVELVREGSALEIRVKEPQKALQVCDAVDTAPAQAFKAVVNLTTKDMSGKAFLHFRGMGPDDALVYYDGKPDITHAGPLKDGANVIVKDVTLGKDSPKLRVCVMLDGLTGTVRMEDVALYPWDSAIAIAAAASAPAAEAPQGWRFFPPDAPKTTLRTVGSGLEFEVDEASPTLQACGPTVAWKPPMKASVKAHATNVAGKAFVHLRAIGADGVVLKDGDKGYIEHVGPLTASGTVEETRALAFPPETALVRPCVVLDGVTGTVGLDALSIVEGK